MPEHLQNLKELQLWGSGESGVVLTRNYNYDMLRIHATLELEVHVEVKD